MRERRTQAYMALFRDFLSTELRKLNVSGMKIDKKDELSHWNNEEWNAMCFFENRCFTW